MTQKYTTPTTNSYKNIQEIKVELNKMSKDLDLLHFEDGDEFILSYKKTPIARTVLPFKETQASLVQENAFAFIPNVTSVPEDLLKKIVVILSYWNSY